MRKKLQNCKGHIKSITYTCITSTYSTKTTKITRALLSQVVLTTYGIVIDKKTVK